MILEAINKKPFIHFGFNQQEITAIINQPIKVWQDTLLLREIIISQQFLKKVNNNFFEITYNQEGNYELQIENSNTLKIIIL